MLTVAQVFEPADLVGRRPVGNVRKLKENAYRLRFRRHGEIRTHPEVFTGRVDAERALWKVGMDGRADRTHDGRFRALMLGGPGLRDETPDRRSLPASYGDQPSPGDRQGGMGAAPPRRHGSQALDLSRSFG
ncbi:hypothetical protein [Streptosporangium sandarakinum]|uniref:Uncharacterized protein n=1 Tax=Streptosporangium sandarakinum TaxID=1260955 RepID=A0A852UXX9_9ACTN|nr:hypothetical protein [Streptosporangium sandarakinum]NYF40318.1 hypothetical protein [Streptosporangium sandarakinum]